MTSGSVPGSLIIHTVVLVQAEDQHILAGHPGRVMGSEQYSSSDMLYSCQSVYKVGSILNLVTSLAPQQALHPPMFSHVLRTLSITDPFLPTSVGNFRNTTSWKYWSHGNLCLCGGSMDIPEILPLTKPLGAKLWYGMWSVTYPRRKGWGKAGKGKGKGSKMKASHKILNMLTRMARSKRLEAFVFACIWDKYRIPQPGILAHPSSILQSSRGLTKPILGHVCDRRFVMKMFCYEKWALSKSTGCDEDSG